MSLSEESKFRLDIHPVSPERWDDLERLFGPRGACGGCWCMWWRLSAAEFNAQKGEGNRRAMKRIVESGEVPGLLAYTKGEPVGWCAVAPRESYPRLERSRVRQRIDDRPVWSVVCFYIAKSYRRSGVMTALLEATVDYVREQGGTIVEGYPKEPTKDPTPPLFLYMGVPSAFRAAGFEEVACQKEGRPIMRYVIHSGA